jgi:hypothetical protein
MEGDAEQVVNGWMGLGYGRLRQLISASGDAKLASPHSSWMDGATAARGASTRLACFGLLERESLFPRAYCGYREIPEGRPSLLDGRHFYIDHRV